MVTDAKKFRICIIDILGKENKFVQSSGNLGTAGRRNKKKKTKLQSSNGYELQNGHYEMQASLSFGFAAIYKRIALTENVLFKAVGRYGA